MLALGSWPSWGDTRVSSYYDFGNPALVSKDRDATYAMVALAQARSLEQFDAVRDLLDAPGLQTQLGAHISDG